MAKSRKTRAGVAAAQRANATVAVQIASAFRRHGVEVVFGQSLPTAFHLAAPQFGIRQATYRTENAGGAMADAYARISRRVGVVTAQNGPAATLLVPPLAEAFKASVPMVALVQEVARTATGRNAFQELDHLKLFDGVAKWVRRIDHASRVEDTVDMAFMAATSGRPGPAVLLVPYDLLNEAVPHLEQRAARMGEVPLDRVAPDPERVAEAARMLAEAERPIVIAGGGVHMSGAATALALLQEVAQLPVATTVMGKGVVSETHPLSVGVVGYVMGRGARSHDLRDLVSEADVVLLVGNRTNQNGTDSWSLYPQRARYIHLDIDGQEVGRNYEAVRLVGDARLGLVELARQISELDLTRRRAASHGLGERIGAARLAWRQQTRRLTQEAIDPIRPERLMAILDDMIDADTVMVADASYSSIWIANNLIARAPGQRFITPRGIAGLGWGLPYAIGAKLARPEARVVCLAGDGGFGHTWAELETVRRLGLDIIVIVLDNQILGYQKDAEDANFGAHTDAVFFEGVDHAAIARACGCDGVTVTASTELRAVIESAFASGKPTLIDIKIDPEARPPITAFEGRLKSVYMGES
jgi:acetolactate synthase-1/2/3 large subunit